MSDDDATVLQYQNAVAAEHAGQTMREDQRGTPAHQPVDPGHGVRRGDRVAPGVERLRGIRVGPWRKKGARVFDHARGVL